MCGVSQYVSRSLVCPAVLTSVRNVNPRDGDCSTVCSSASQSAARCHLCADRAAQRRQVHHVQPLGREEGGARVRHARGPCHQGLQRRRSHSFRPEIQGHRHLGPGPFHGRWHHTSASDSHHATGAHPLLVRASRKAPAAPLQASKLCCSAARQLLAPSRRAHAHAISRMHVTDGRHHRRPHPCGYRFSRTSPRRSSSLTRAPA
jgi:hypothetical protein